MAFGNTTLGSQVTLTGSEKSYAQTVHNTISKQIYSDLLFASFSLSSPKVRFDRFDLMD